MTVIHVHNSKINDYYFQRRQPVLEITNSNFNSLYKNGQIYKISLDDKICIGSTCETLKTRLNQHMEDPKSTVYKYLNKN